MGKKYSDKTQLTWGEHKYKSLDIIPAGYLLDLYENKKTDDAKLLAYIEKNLELLRARRLGKDAEAALRKKKAEEAAAAEKAKAAAEREKKEARMAELEAVFTKRGSRLICIETDKIVFAKENDARHEIRRIRGIDQESKKPVRAYECLKCAGWHLTSMPFEDWEKMQEAEVGNWHAYSKQMLRLFEKENSVLANKVAHLEEQMTLLREESSQLRETNKQLSREINDERRLDKHIVSLEKKLLAQRTENEKLTQEKKELVNRLFEVQGKKKKE